MKIFVAVFAGPLALIFVAVILIDPYDTGRFPTLMGPGVSDENQQTANASRGRDPRFDAAIVGNSHAQLLDPRRLSQATGLNFVQLTSPGSGPRELDATLRYFARHHPRVAAAVLSADQRWCSREPNMPVTFPFPFWLYRGDLEYLGNMLSSRSISASQKRIRLARGRLPLTDPVGYWDYETGRPWNFHPAPPVREIVDLRPNAIDDADFPPLDFIDGTIAALPAATRVVIVLPPQFVTQLPRKDSREARDLVGCKHELARRAALRPLTTVLDFLLDTPMARDPANFMDAEHYRSNVARMIEGRIVAALRAMDGQAHAALAPPEK